MKKLTLIFTLLFSTVMFSSPSYAKWTKVSEHVSGKTIYVDFERIRKHGGFVYFWFLVEYLKPIKSGTLSTRNYRQGDCKLFRFKDLSLFSHKEPMGGGTSNPYTPPDKWWYPSPNSANEIILKQVCSR
jgi:hypothetical protein